MSIPVDQIDIPHFRYSGKKYWWCRPGGRKKSVQLLAVIAIRMRSGKAGDAPGEHMLEVDVSLEELAQMLGDELELPNICPKGKKNVRE